MEVLPFKIRDWEDRVEVAERGNQGTSISDFLSPFLKWKAWPLTVGSWRNERVPLWHHQLVLSTPEVKREWSGEAGGGWGEASLRALGEDANQGRENSFAMLINKRLIKTALWALINRLIKLEPSLEQIESSPPRLLPLLRAGLRSQTLCGGGG